MTALSAAVADDDADEILALRAKLARVTKQRDGCREALQHTADLLRVWIDGAPPYDEAANDRSVLEKARAAIANAT